MRSTQWSILGNLFSYDRADGQSRVLSPGSTGQSRVLNLVVKDCIRVPRLIPRLAYPCRTPGLIPCDDTLLWSLQWVGGWCLVVYTSPLFSVPGRQYIMNYPCWTLSLT